MSKLKSNTLAAVRRAIGELPDGPRSFLGRAGVWLTNTSTPAEPAPTPARVPADRLLPSRPLPLPDGVSEAELRQFFHTWSIDGEPEGHMDPYVADSLGRFVHTFGLVADLHGTCLELGANPYFTTRLIQEFTDIDLSLANYFGADGEAVAQVLDHRSFDGTPVHTVLESKLFNIEDDEFPYDDASFDIVLYCEIIEHLLMDPVEVLRKIRRILRPDGVLVLTTPNVGRLKNVLRLAAGENLYDPYSGYGPYGRHNREYTMHELHALLGFLGFEIEQSFTADSHPDSYEDLPHYDELAPVLEPRRDELGQYLFVRARMTGPAREGLPDLLFRSYPDGVVVPI